MNKERLQQLLSGDLSGNAIEELEALIEKYPYFQSAYVLLSKASSDNGHHAFEDHLFDAAMQVRDREQLFHTIMRPLVQKAIEKANKEIESIPDEEVREELASARIDSQIIDHPEVEESQSDTSLPLGKVEETELSMEEALVEQETTEAGSIENPEAEAILDESLILEEQVTIEENDEQEKTQVLDPELEEDLLVHAISASIEQEVMEQEAKPISEAEKEETEEQVITSFSAWIYQRAKDIHYVEENEGATDFPDPETSQQHLIDKFIKAEPRITPSRLDEFAPPEQAAKALLEDEEFVTETLAKVYASQGNMRKARKAYKLLALKFPEKSVYFANQIKKLGNQSSKK